MVFTVCCRSFEPKSVEMGLAEVASPYLTVGEEHEVRTATRLQDTKPKIIARFVIIVFNLHVRVFI
jgi:hypothetical protein